jgi:hypothetical protein
MRILIEHWPGQQRAKTVILGLHKPDLSGIDIFVNSKRNPRKELGITIQDRTTQAIVWRDDAKPMMFHKQEGE